jgi:hypothetical protein
VRVRYDYETEDVLAVFPNPDTAREALRRVRQALADPHRAIAVPLSPGRCQLADVSLQEVVHGAMQTARLSVPLGALVGLGLAAAAVPGAGTLVLAGLGLAGAIGGFVVGGMTGAINHTRWDRDPAQFLEVPPDSQYMLVIVEASPAPARRETSKVVGILTRAGAIGFLDPAAYYAAQQHAVASRS